MNIAKVLKFNKNINGSYVFSELQTYVLELLNGNQDGKFRGAICTMIIFQVSEEIIPEPGILPNRFQQMLNERSAAKKLWIKILKHKYSSGSFKKSTIRIENYRNFEYYLSMISKTCPNLSLTSMDASLLVTTKAHALCDTLETTILFSKKWKLSDTEVAF